MPRVRETGLQFQTLAVNDTRALVRQAALAGHATEPTFIWVRGNRQLLQAFLAETIPNPALRVYPVSLLEM